MTFDQLIFRPLLNGVQALHFFDNVYGASVIKHPFSYGGPSGLYELAVIRGDEGDWVIVYDTPVTDDVEGWLSPERVTELLTQIEALPAKGDSE